MPSGERAAYSAHPGEYEAKVRASLVECISQHCLVVDEHPTYTRFFTFAANFGKLLTLCLLGIQDRVLKLASVVPRKENKVRLTKVLSFTGLPGALNYLKRTSVALALTTRTHSICAESDPGQDPPLVQLAKGRVRVALQHDFARQVASLPLDPDLDKGAALTLLLCTAADTLARFRFRFRTHPGFSDPHHS